MLYGEWLLDWLRGYVEISVKRRTYTCYRDIVERHIMHRLGGVDINEINPNLLQRYISELTKRGNKITGEGLSTNSVNSIVTVLKSSLKTAHDLGYTAENAGEKIKRPKPREKRIECFSAAEQKKIEEFILASNKPKFFGIVICLYTGLRIGELLALEWRDIDFLSGELSVNKSCHYGKDASGKYMRITDTPKTSSSIRKIPIPKQLLPHFKKIKKESRSTHVVANGERLISIRSYQRSFSDILRRLNIRRRGFHSLRHTFATRALECGIDVKTLSEILGHKSPTVTLNRYAHCMTEHKKEMMNKLGKLL